MARQAGVSVPHFSRCFRKAVGQTPKQYLHASRMRAAAGDLVAEPVQPIKQVSRRAGYATVHAFTHAFKEFFGVSPGRYRKHPVSL
jgi:AraC-like DNA-binding protein